MTTFVVDHLSSSGAPGMTATASTYGAGTTTAGMPSAPATTTLYVVQKCWLDGPRYARPIDCARLWTTSDAATQFAHASAIQYASIVEHKKSFNSGRLVTSQRSSPTVRTLLLDNHQYGFATSGRLFWVRAVHVPLCPCHANFMNDTHPFVSSTTTTTTTTALVRLHQGVVGGTSASGGRRGTEDVLDCARLDCPKNCLQTWITSQLCTHQACSWLRVPVGNALHKSNSAMNHHDDWWKEQWSDWETWGGGGGGVPTTGLEPAAVPAAEGAVVPGTAAPTPAAHKRRCSWSGDRNDNAMDEEEEEDFTSTTMVATASSESTWHGHASPNTARGRLVTEDHHHQQHHQHMQNVANSNWFAPSSVDYAPNKRSVAATASSVMGGNAFIGTTR